MSRGRGSTPELYGSGSFSGRAIHGGRGGSGWCSSCVEDDDIGADGVEEHGPMR